MNKPVPQFTDAELVSYGLTQDDAEHLTERDWLEMDWLRQGHKMPREWVNPRKGMNYTRPVMKQAVLKLLRQGRSNGDTARKTGLGSRTVRRLRQEADTIFHCRCGKPGNHRGFCSTRFRRSIKRMQVMQHFTLHSPRHYIGLQIPMSRWLTYRYPLKAARSITTFLAMNIGATVDDWEAIFQSQREAIIDLKIAVLVARIEAAERAHLVRPTVSDFFRKLAVPSALEYAKNAPEN